jgi:hypothetical protein
MADECWKERSAYTPSPTHPFKNYTRRGSGVYWISRASIFPRSSLLGAGQLGFWEVGGGVGQLDEGVQTGSVYKQPEREEDNSCHIWREPSKWKGTQRGASKGSKGKCAMYIRKRNVCARVIEPLE